ncbi:MAG TPA: nucleotidyltransferase domain-containing protein [Propionibacteriaceae bacterium]
MDLKNPIQSVIPSAHGAVLGVLARTNEPLSGRRVAELTTPKFAQTQVNQVLRKLAASGIVLLENRPPSNLYRLNHDHVAAEGILALARIWTTLVARIRAELNDWSMPPQAAWLFGSAARGDATAHSDIDMLLVVPDGGLETEAIAEVWDRQTEALTEHIKAWSGNACEVLEVTRSELAAAVERDDRLVHDLRGQAVLLAGDDPRALLRKQALR